jgi:mannose-1-phosphate guanylyltransferase
LLSLKGNIITEFVEKPPKESAPSNLINSGLYILEPEALDMVPPGNSFMEIDVFPKIAKTGKLLGYHFEGQWFDTGTMERYEKAIKEWKDIE